MREFTTRPSGGKALEYSFKLDNQVFTAKFRNDDADFVLVYSEMAAAASQAGMDAATPEGASILTGLLQLLLGPQYPTLKMLLRGKDSQIIADIMEELMAQVEASVEGEADRPTMPSAGSSAGQPARKGDRASRLALLAGGDVDLTVVDGSGEARQVPTATTRRAQPKAGKSRRRAG